MPVYTATVIDMMTGEIVPPRSLPKEKMRLCSLLIV